MPKPANHLQLLAALVFLTATAVAQDAAAFKLTVKNGGMSQGFDIPADWQKDGPGAVTRDAAVFKVGPASLSVKTGGSSTQGFQEITGRANTKFTVAGWIKTAGAVKAQVFVHAFAEGFKKNQFIQVKYAAGDGDWTPFEKEIVLPEWTAFFRIGLMAEGEGQAWLDEVHDAGGAVDPGKPQTQAERRTSAAPPKAMPSVPGWGFYPQFPTAWQSAFDSQLRRTKEGEIDIIFLGDSITQGWGDTGKVVWDKRYAPRKAVNYGIGGDSTRQILWRLDHGLVDGLKPKVVVLKIGTNNLYDDFNGGSDQEIANGIETTVKALRAKLPKTRVLVLGILPRQNEFFSSRILRINALVAKLDDGNAVRFLDIGAQFQKTPGKGDVLGELYNDDHLHLAAKGYEVLANAIQPLFDEMMMQPLL